ncbi:MAG: rRNA maturation RNase YbeY [Gammaproteobacteria bacterium]|nr:rRNA maturation RNase YbeY [Gammaproteobacteria bacterium]
MNAATTRDAPELPRIDVQVAASPSPSRNALMAWARAALADDGRRLCIRVVDENEARELNARFRDRVESTNVLSFPAQLPDVLGDVAVCAPVVAREAKAQHKSVDAHFAHMVVHGVLHLRGMDHGTEAQAREMEAAEIEILRAFGLDDPYSAAVENSKPEQSPV